MQCFRIKIEEPYLTGSAGGSDVGASSRFKP